MAFDKAYLKLKKNNPRGIPDEYTYWGRDDTIAEITAAGYFDESAFATKEDPRRNLTDPPDTDAYAIHVEAADGPYEVQLVGGVASVVLKSTDFVSDESQLSEKLSLVDEISILGELELSETFVVSLSNKTITGGTLKSSTIKSLIQIGDCSNVTFNGVTFSTSVSDAAADLKGIVHSSNSSISNLKFINCKFSGVNANINALKFVHENTKHLNGLVVDGCDFSDVGRMGLEIQNHNDGSPDFRYRNITVKNSTFSQIGTISQGMAMSFSGVGKTITVDKNEFSGCTGPCVELVGAENVTITKNDEIDSGVGGMFLSFTDGGASRINRDVKIYNNNSNSSNTILISASEDVSSGGNTFNVVGDVIELRGLTRFKSINDTYRTDSTRALYYDGDSDNTIINAVIDNSSASSNFATLRSNSGESLKVVNSEIIKGPGGSSYDTTGTGVNPTFRDCTINGTFYSDPIPIGGQVLKGLSKTVGGDTASFDVEFGSTASWRGASIFFTVTSCNNSGANYAYSTTVIHLRHQGTNIAGQTFTNIDNSGITVSLSVASNVITVSTQNTVGSSVTFVYDISVVSVAGVGIS